MCLLHKPDFTQRFAVQVKEAHGKPWAYLVEGGEMFIATHRADAEDKRKALRAARRCDND